MITIIAIMTMFGLSALGLAAVLSSGSLLSKIDSWILRQLVEGPKVGFEIIIGTRTGPEVPQRSIFWPNWKYRIVGLFIALGGLLLGLDLLR